VNFTDGFTKSCGAFIFDNFHRSVITKARHRPNKWQQAARCNKKHWNTRDSSLTHLWFCLSVCLSVRTIKQNGWNENRHTWHRDSQPRYLAHQLILDQRSQGQKVEKVATRQLCGAVSLRCDAAQRDGAARPAWVMHSIECPASRYNSVHYC